MGPHSRSNADLLSVNVHSPYVGDSVPQKASRVKSQGEMSTAELRLVLSMQGTSDEALH